MVYHACVTVIPAYSLLNPLTCSGFCRFPAPLQAGTSMDNCLYKFEREKTNVRKYLMAVATAAGLLANFAPPAEARGFCYNRYTRELIHWGSCSRSEYLHGAAYSQPLNPRDTSAGPPHWAGPGSDGGCWCAYGVCHNCPGD